MKGHSESEVADDAIARLVRRGVVAHEDLAAARVSAKEIAVRVRRKRLIPPWRGVYLVGHEDPALFALEYAALRFAGPSATLGDRPAAAIHRLLPPQVDPTIHLSLTGGDLRITTPERTILDVAPTLDDEQLDNVIAPAIRNRLTTERKLAAQLQRRRGHRGTRRIRQILGEGPELTAPEAERLLLAMLRSAELDDGAELNRRMSRRMPDVVWRRPRVIVEIDSWCRHGNRRSFSPTPIADPAGRRRGGSRSSSRPGSCASSRSW